MTKFNFDENELSLIRAMKEYATEHYGDKKIRFDYVIETWGDEDFHSLFEEIVGEPSVTKCMKVMRARCRMYGEQESNCW